MSRFSHVQRAFEDLRPYVSPLIVLLIVSLLAVPMTLIFPLPIKLLVDSVLGSQPLPTSILTLGAMILVMVFLDWELALIALLVSPLMFILTFVFRPRIRAGWRKFRASESAAMAVAQESLGASRLVKSYGQEERKNKQLVSHYSASLNAQLKVQVDNAVYSLLVGVVTAAGLAAVLYIGIGHVPGILTLGSLLVVNYYVTQLYGPLRNVGQSILDIQMSLTGVDRYRAV